MSDSFLSPKGQFIERKVFIIIKIHYFHYTARKSAFLLWIHLRYGIIRETVCSSNLPLKIVYELRIALVQKTGPPNTLSSSNSPSQTFNFNDISSLFELTSNFEFRLFLKCLHQINEIIMTKLLFQSKVFKLLEFLYCSDNNKKLVISVFYFFFIFSSLLCGLFLFLYIILFSCILY